MNELSSSQVTIHDHFWDPRLSTNAQVSIFHQWKQLESTHCIDNFRLAAGQTDGFREGWFFADSDAYKWLEAAARIQAKWPSENLKHLMDDFIDLLSRVQKEDGYIYTYNQIHFPNHRWDNLMIEHELYCHGHLIEACVSHFEAIGEETALHIARKAADLLVNVFLSAASDKTSGHEEIEIALLRIYQLSQQENYLKLASQFIERRGKVRPFAPLLLKQNSSVARRRKIVQEQHKVFLANHPDQSSFRLPEDNIAQKTHFGKLRWEINALTGKYFQQHTPIRKQTVPVGHSVRYAYLETAIAKLYRCNSDTTLLPALIKSWDNMVTKRMYITGGIGSLPELEGFGRDYELDPEIAYAETCAALGSLFWNWEMALITKDARYSDLFEWQLYNAAAVGMGLGGDTYLYNNPLLSRGGITRRTWFLVPCCPSNLSRTWASLERYIYSFDRENLWIHQYIGNQSTVDGGRWEINMQSSLPWHGTVSVALGLEEPSDFTLHLRIPSWATAISVRINNQPFVTPLSPSGSHSNSPLPPASGYDPSLAFFLPIRRAWSPGDIVNLEFETSIFVRHASTRMRGHKGKIALTRGPLVYCLESIDNPGIDILNVRIIPDSIRTEFAPALLGGIWILHGKTTGGKDFIAIPYHLWANRGESQMTVWINAEATSSKA
jgi:DUF1680 family protein